MHRAWRITRPVRMRFGPFSAHQQAGQLTKFIGRIKLGARVAPAVPIEEDAVDRLRLGRQCSDQRPGGRTVLVAAFYAETEDEGIDQRLIEAATPLAQEF